MIPIHQADAEATARGDIGTTNGAAIDWLCLSQAASKSSREIIAHVQSFRIHKDATLGISYSVI